MLPLFTACNVEQFLQKDQHIVRKNTIEVRNVKSNRTKTTLKTELATLYKQRDLPDLFAGRKSKNGAWYWFKSLKADSTTNRFQRWQYRNFSRPASFFDEKATAATVDNIKQYLQNSGYLYPSVFSEKNFHGKEKGMADVTYYVDPGRLYVIDSTEFVCSDTDIEYLLNDLDEQTVLRRGAPLDARLYEQERQRITESLNNLGYARFTLNYIAPLEADTTYLRFDAKGNRLVNIKLTVQKPSDPLAFKNFRRVKSLFTQNLMSIAAKPLLLTLLLTKKSFLLTKKAILVYTQPPSVKRFLYCPIRRIERKMLTVLCANSTT